MQLKVWQLKIDLLNLGGSFCDDLHRPTTKKGYTAFHFTTLCHDMEPSQHCLKPLPITLTYYYNRSSISNSNSRTTNRD